MKLKMVPFAVTLLLLVHLSSRSAPFPMPQARSAPITGATVQTFFHSPSENQMTLRVTNTSTKNITGYILSVHAIGAGDEKSDFHSIYDFLSNAMFVQRFAGTGDEDYYRKQVGPPFLTPGQSYDQISAMPANYQDMSVLITAVAYSDKSAEAISQDALEPLIEQREAEATALSKANEIISANDPQTAIQKIENLRDVSEAKPHAKLEINEARLDFIIEDLKNNPDLKAYQVKNERERAVWADQAQLKLGGAL